MLVDSVLKIERRGFEEACPYSEIGRFLTGGPLSVSHGRGPRVGKKITCDKASREREHIVFDVFKDSFAVFWRHSLQRSNDQGTMGRRDRDLHCSSVHGYQKGRK